MEIADDPLVLTRRLSLRGGSEVLFRPLAHAGAAHRARFLEALSPEPRRLGAFDGYGSATARELCDAIARHDKLRLVLEEVRSGLSARHGGRPAARQDEGHPVGRRPQR